MNKNDKKNINFEDIETVLNELNFFNQKEKPSLDNKNISSLNKEDNNNLTEKDLNVFDKKNINFEDIETVLKNPKEFIFLENQPLSQCDPYYIKPIKPYPKDENWEIEFDGYNAVYEEEIKQDTMRYPLILEMLEKKKEMAENPIIFDKEEQYYETDPHKLVFFDENFTPFFEQENNEIFFRNLKDPLRIKWEEIPEQDRIQKIVHFDEAIAKLKYEEIQEYFDKYLISKDIVLLFIQYMPKFWPIRKFFPLLQRYVAGKEPHEIYTFFIEKVLILSSRYKTYDDLPLTKNGKRASSFLKTTYILKKQLFKELSNCLKSSENLTIESDILTNFINEYDLFEEPTYEGISRVYKFREIAKIIILLNLSFFNIFLIEDNKAFERLRKINKPLFLTFLWYLKDLYWKDYESPLRLKKDIKSYFQNKDEYNKLNNLIECYPFSVVIAKEYFYTHHNVILREEVQRKLAVFDKEQDKKAKENYRFNADFYVLNKELQNYEKQKEKIYSKFRKLQKSEAEIRTAIENAYKRHLKTQKHLSKFLFKRKSLKEKPIESEEEIRTSISFYINEKKDIETKTYDQLIAETTTLFNLTLQALDLYDDISKEYLESAPKQYDEENIYKKIFEDKLIEPNFWNKFKDYCFIAIDRYPNRITTLSELYEYQKEFIIEFLRDIIGIWGTGNYIPKGISRVLYKPTKRRRKRLL